mmetsp:Transcript_10457/g.22434  ORF Transcript_10457/g.22434 Transcript_10457/m.22434 type:complete len:244 (+) Transcript_10457:479-1210(+)
MLAPFWERTSPPSFTPATCLLGGCSAALIGAVTGPPAAAAMGCAAAGPSMTAGAPARILSMKPSTSSTICSAAKGAAWGAAEDGVSAAAAAAAAAASEVSSAGLGIGDLRPLPRLPSWDERRELLLLPDWRGSLLDMSRQNLGAEGDLRSRDGREGGWACVEVEAAATAAVTAADAAAAAGTTCGAEDAGVGGGAVVTAAVGLVATEGTELLVWLPGACTAASPCCCCCCWRSRASTSSALSS